MRDATRKRKNYAEFIEDYQNGMSFAELAVKHGYASARTASSTMSRLRAMGLTDARRREMPKWASLYKGE